MKKIKIILVAIIFLIISLFFIAYCTKETHMYSDSDLYPDSETLTVNLGSTPQIPWNTTDSSTYVVETFASAVYGNLTEINESGAKENSDENVLLEDYFCDGNVCYATLKKGIQFHNGREVSAYDVEFSFLKQLLKHENDNFAFTILDDLKGIDDFNKRKNDPIKALEINGIRYPSGLLDGIKVIDNHKLVLNLKHENQFIFQKLSTGFLPIVPIEEFEKDYSTWKHFPVGFGKYKVIKSDFNRHEFVLERHDKKGNTPQYVRIIFKDNDIGDIRVVVGMPENSSYDGKILFPNIYVTGGFLFNFKTELGSNPNFRKAISLALDREKIASTSKYGELVAEDQLLPDFGWQKEYRANMPIQKQNIALAKEYLKKVPKHLIENIVFPVHTFWTTRKNIFELRYIQEIASELNDIGINVKFLETDENYTKFEKDDKNVLWWTGFDTETDDPNANFAYFKKGSFFNNIYPDQNEKFDMLYQKSVENIHSSKEYTRDLSEYFTKNDMMVVVVNLRKSYLYHKDRIESLGKQYSGIKLEVWKVKLKHLHLF